MRFLSLYGSDGFRTFMGMLNGRLDYAPDRIPLINPEILTEHDYSMRLEEIIAPYADNHPALKNILPDISQKIGTLSPVSEKLSVWTPKYHLSYLPQLILASLFEEFIDDLSDLSFIAMHEDNGDAFKHAFSLEKKLIYVPEEQSVEIDPLTSYSFYSSAPDIDSKFRLDQHNIFRIAGHICTIIEALYQSEKSRQRFYNDPVSLVIPADSMEYVLAAYYLSKSSFPIKNIYTVSQRHRMVHKFLQSGEFKVSNLQEYKEFQISLDRMLFELARGSAEKVVFWKKELASKGWFKVDSTAMEGLKIFNSSFLSPKSVENSGLPLVSDINVTPLSAFGYELSLSNSEHILVFELK